MENNDSSRESLGSRLGFILLTAGCAIGLGNIWRFPFICGQYGGAIFVLIYLFFLIALGMPVMVMELSLGRASRRNIYGAYKTLNPNPRLKWHYPGAVFFLGNIILMMFYTTVTGWMIAYALAGTAVFVLYCIRAFRYLLGKCGDAEEGVSAEDRQKVPDCAENAGGESAAECAAQKKELSETEKNTPAEDKLFSDEAPPLAGT